MKISQSLYSRVIEFEVRYNVYQSLFQVPIVPRVRTLKFHFNSSKYENLWFEIQGLTFEQWLNSILGYKIVIASKDHLDPKIPMLTELFGDPLFVENTDEIYLYDTIFKILTQILPETVYLDSIQYD